MHEAETTAETAGILILLPLVLRTSLYLFLSSSGSLIQRLLLNLTRRCYCSCLAFLPCVVVVVVVVVVAAVVERIQILPFEAFARSLRFRTCIFVVAASLVVWLRLTAAAAADVSAACFHCSCCFRCSCCFVAATASQQLLLSMLFSLQLLLSMRFFVAAAAVGAVFVSAVVAISVVAIVVACYCYYWCGSSSCYCFGCCCSLFRMLGISINQLFRLLLLMLP